MNELWGSKSRIATVVLAGAIVAMLSGCAANVVASPAESKSPTVESSPTVEPSTPPAEAEIDLADPSSWLIGFEGVGPVIYEGQLAAVRSSMGAYTEDAPADCPRATFSAAGAPGIWAMLDEDWATIGGVVLTGDADPNAVAQGSPRTAEGIGIGSTTADLLAAYPEITSAVGPYNGTDYALEGNNGVWMVFRAYEGADQIVSIELRNDANSPNEYCG